MKLHDRACTFDVDIQNNSSDDAVFRLNGLHQYTSHVYISTHGSQKKNKFADRTLQNVFLNKMYYFSLLKTTVLLF